MTASRLASIGCSAISRRCEGKGRRGSRSELADVTAKVVIYEALVKGKLEAPKHLDRTVHDLYFEPEYDERVSSPMSATVPSYRPSTMVVSSMETTDTDDNPRADADPDFTPFITTPAFSSYPSAHASASYAGREIVQMVFGCGKHFITLSHPEIPGVVLHYTNLGDITENIDDARIYGGIHFRFDQEAGAAQGHLVGAVTNRFRPTTISEPCCCNQPLQSS